jgi:hypothetical protein
MENEVRMDQSVVKGLLILGGIGAVLMGAVIFAGVLLGGGAGKDLLAGMVRTNSGNVVTYQTEDGPIQVDIDDRVVVLVAKQRIAPGEHLMPDSFFFKEIPRHFVDDDAILEDELDEYLMRPAVQAIAVEAMILKAFFDGAPDTPR